MPETERDTLKEKPTANWRVGDYIWFIMKCAFLSLAILYLLTYAEFSAVKAIYEAY